MVDKWEVGDIGVQGSVINDVAKVKWIKILRKFQTKKIQSTVVHTSTEDCVEPINIMTFVLFPVYFLFLYM